MTRPCDSSSQTRSTVPALPLVRTTALPTSSISACSKAPRIVDARIFASESSVSVMPNKPRSECNVPVPVRAVPAAAAGEGLPASATTGGAQLAPREGSTQPAGWRSVAPAAAANGAATARRRGLRRPVPRKGQLGPQAGVPIVVPRRQRRKGGTARDDGGRSWSLYRAKDQLGAQGWRSSGAKRRVRIFHFQQTHSS